jgi:hypothetical protein
MAVTHASHMRVKAKGRKKKFIASLFFLCLKVLGRVTWMIAP